MRVVLDTNVCLDVFVFADPRAAQLVVALASGTVEAVTRADCRDEWLAVLHYPALKLDAARRAEAQAAFDRFVRLWPDADADADAGDGNSNSDSGGAIGSRHTVPLPRCRDPDDQKFLELARAAGARVLFSRDAEVLRLGRRTVREGWFAILRPEDWEPTRPAPGR